MRKVSTTTATNDHHFKNSREEKESPTRDRTLHFKDRSQTLKQNGNKDEFICYDHHYDHHYEAVKFRQKKKTTLHLRDKSQTLKQRGNKEEGIYYHRHNNRHFKKNAQPETKHCISDKSQTLKQRRNKEE
ncbi:hypothetical protein BaRGS_00024004, partial [Batillaria attramentaria]